ncbi:phage tail assembly protein [Acinetobacter nectaris]|uniref:phage tail assembly protein n=1 Tax=Acinetobacter nectaris TaxID=1219382 RepID=UPI001F4384FC|nr:phage tail assembly protein [Acinetobacter nectaris]MCF9034706.1 phage tail assembly protein [Acinetobacter nectaris]
MSTKTQNENQAVIQQKHATIELDEPIHMGGNTIESIEINKPNIQALQGIKLADLLQGDVTAICHMLPRVSTPSLTKAEIHQLEPADIAQIGGVLINFLQPKSTRVEM